MQKYAMMQNPQDSNPPKISENSHKKIFARWKEKEHVRNIKKNSKINKLRHLKIQKKRSYDYIKACKIWLSECM